MSQRYSSVRRWAPACVGAAILVDAGLAVYADAGLPGADAWLVLADAAVGLAFALAAWWAVGPLPQRWLVAAVGIAWLAGLWLRRSRRQGCDQRRRPRAATAPSATPTPLDVRTAFPLPGRKAVLVPGLPTATTTWASQAPHGCRGERGPLTTVDDALLYPQPGEEMRARAAVVPWSYELHEK
jgi:hypothetical protein